MVNKGGKVLRK